MELQKIKTFTSSEVSDSDKTYNTIASVLTKLSRHGVLVMGVGNCISMSDIVKTALKHKGIESRLVEVSATFTYYSHQPSSLRFVGFDEITNPGEIDTHVVIVTETSPSYLIDASIMHYLPQGVPVLVEPIDKKLVNDRRTLIESDFQDHQIKVTYLQKRKQIVPALHQESIIERIKTDEKIFKSIDFLTKLNYIGIVLGLFALVNVVIKIIQLFLHGDITW
jgi:hypothetical protein